MPDVHDETANALATLIASDSRINFIDDHRVGDWAAALNVAFESVTTDYFLLLDQHDLVSPKLVSTLKRTIEGNTSADLLYANENQIGRFGRMFGETRKPVWSPEKLRGYQYLEKCVFFRTQMVQNLGGVDIQFGVQMFYDLVLRVSEQAHGTIKISEVLYHRRAVNSKAESKSALKLVTERQASQLGVRAVQLHLNRCGVNATVKSSPNPNFFQVIRSTKNVGPISVVIPTRGTSGTVFGEERVFIESLIRGLVEQSGNHEIEFVVVFDDATPQTVLDNLRNIAGDLARFVPYSKPFNFSSKCNLGAVHATYENLVFLNDDMQCVSEDVLANLVAPLDEPGVGLTGAKLLFEDGTIQHAGHIHEMGDNRINYYGAPFNSSGVNGALLINREVSGVTGACMAIKKTVFFEVGGFSEIFPNSYNDVDLSNKVSAAGYRIVWLANVLFSHFESKSRQPVVNVADYENIIRRWGRSSDEFYT